MVFSFFKKSKQPEPPEIKPKAVKPVQPAPRQNAAVQPAPASEPAELDMHAADEISIDEGSASAESHSAVEEAAIFFANERVSEAIATLEHFLEENAQSRDVQPWWLLFDLYHLQGMKQKFDELSLDFVVKFERSPPVWDDTAKTPQPQKTAAKTGSGYVGMIGMISAASESEIQRLSQLAEAGAVRLDFAGAQEIDASGGELLSTALQKLRKNGKKVSLQGASHLTTLLKQTLEGEGRQEMPLWQTLFELYQWQGLEAEFEDMAVEYAITFELSPPSWEAVPEMEQAAPEAADNEEAPATEQSVENNFDGFYMEGVISNACEPKFKELVKYAATQTEVKIDMAQVTRVDFMTVGLFIGALIEINQALGKKIVLIGVNEMVRALFDVMGIHQFASVPRKKSR